MGQKTLLTRNELRYLAADILGSTEAAQAWLLEPRQEFDGCSAEEILDTDLGFGQVVMELRRLEMDLIRGTTHGQSVSRSLR